jgi:hypothetical protein
LIDWWLRGLIDKHTDTKELILQGLQPKRDVNNN